MDCIGRDNFRREGTRITMSHSGKFAADGEGGRPRARHGATELGGSGFGPPTEISTACPVAGKALAQNQPRNFARWRRSLKRATGLGLVEPLDYFLNVRI
jgi:hypothetical protein